MQPSLRERTSTQNPRQSRKNSNPAGPHTNECGWQYHRCLSSDPFVLSYCCLSVGPRMLTFGKRNFLARSAMVSEAFDVPF